MKLTPHEKRFAFIATIIISTKLLGIFLLLPVFSIYAQKYPGATLSLAGVAFGIYALIEGFLQIPFGRLSDKFGRKRVMIFGLALFSLGSLLCAIADNIHTLILARALQGSGAVGSVAIASLGDMVRPQVRAQAFSISGIIIGLAFILSIIISPFLIDKIGFASSFYILAVLGLFGIFLTVLFFPEIKVHEVSNEKKSLLNIIREKEIQSLLVAGFVLSFCLTLFLFIYPLSLESIQVPVNELWMIYLLIVFPSVLFVFPYIKRSEKNGSTKSATILGIVFLLLSFATYLALSFNLANTPRDNTKLLLFIIVGMLFFLGQMIYRSLLPAYLTQRISSGNRGSYSGVFNVANFIGASLGGMLGGYLYSLDPVYPLATSLVIIVLWFFYGLPNQPDRDQMW